MYLFFAFLMVILAVYLCFRQRYSLFSRHDNKSLPTVPFFGNMARVVLRTEHISKIVSRLYFKYPKERVNQFNTFYSLLNYSGLSAFAAASLPFNENIVVILFYKFVVRYEFMRPVLTVRDTEMIKNIVIKDFDHFLDHRNFVDDQNDPLFGRNLLSLKGQEWKDMRATLSPAFTSSKIRNMVPFMVEVAEQAVSSMKKNIEESGVNFKDQDVKDLTTRLANDVIATCAFGLKVDSQNEQDNIFYRMGKETLSFQFRRFFVILAYSSFPILMKYIKISLFTDKVKTFFRNLVMSTMQNREQNSIIRPDMIHLLMQAKKDKLCHSHFKLRKLSIDHHLTKDKDAGFATVEESSVGKKTVSRAWKDDDLIAQAILFLLAGFETISTTLSFFLHEMALNPKVQERLAEEIRETHGKNGGKFDYNTIENMTYMDMVLSETLRRWPVVAALDRKCVKDYNCGKPNDKAQKDFILPKGTTVNIPIWPIHNDPDYYPNPKKFDPERFSEENKHNIKPFTYMPFGLGPRNCIGSRFALAEMKVVIYHLLKDLEVTPCEKTNTSSEISPLLFNTTLLGGFWLRFKVRA